MYVCMYIYYMSLYYAGYWFYKLLTGYNEGFVNFLDCELHVLQHVCVYDIL